MNTSNQILLYGIGGPDKAYGVLNYFCIFKPSEELDLVRTIKYEAERLAAINPSVKHVYMISNSYRLKREYRESVRINSIESHVIFKDILEREGIKLI